MLRTLCITETPTPLKMCSGHCKLTELLQICPNDIIEDLKTLGGRMLHKPNCNASTEEDRMCIPVQGIQTLKIESMEGIDIG